MTGVSYLHFRGKKEKPEQKKESKLFKCNCWFPLFLFQWFGNIVTMDWWDDLWLNEGFASFFEYVGVEEAENTWGMVLQSTSWTTLFLWPFWPILNHFFVVLWLAARYYDHWWCTSCDGGWCPSVLTPDYCQCVNTSRNHICFWFYFL